MAVDGFHLMCLADPEPASSVLSTTHLPKTCSHIYIRSSIPSWQHGRHSDHIRRYGVECAHAPCPHRPIVLPARQPSTSSSPEHTRSLMKRPLAIRSFPRAFRNTARGVSCHTSLPAPDPAQMGCQEPVQVAFDDRPRSPPWHLFTLGPHGTFDSRNSSKHGWPI